MAKEIDDEDSLEAQAASALDAQGGPHGPPDAPPRCPECGHLLDDLESMDERALLLLGRKELIKSLVRGFRDGTSTHQEKSILMGMLRLSGTGSPDVPPPPEDEELPVQGHTDLPAREAPNEVGYDETTGG